MSLHGTRLVRDRSIDHLAELTPPRSRREQRRPVSSCTSPDEIAGVLVRSGRLAASLVSPVDAILHPVIMNSDSGQPLPEWRQEAATLHRKQTERMPPQNRQEPVIVPNQSGRQVSTEGPGWGFPDVQEVHPRERALRPPSSTECCEHHRGDYRGACRGCLADLKTGTPSPEPVGLLPTVKPCTTRFANSWTERTGTGRFTVERRAVAQNASRRRRTYGTSAHAASGRCVLASTNRTEGSALHAAISRSMYEQDGTRDRTPLTLPPSLTCDRS